MILTPRSDYNVVEALKGGLSLSFMYKYDNDMLPELFVDMFTPVRNIHDYNTRAATEHHLYVTFHGTTRSQKCIRYSGAHECNFILTKMDPH